MRAMAEMFASSGHTETSHDPLWDNLSGGMYGGLQSASGQVVTPATATGLSAYRACLQNISADIGKLPFILYRRDGEGGKTRAIDDDRFKLMHSEPNPHMGSMTFRETMTAHAIGWQGGFAEIERTKRGFPLALHIIHPSRVKVLTTLNGTPFYRVNVQAVRAEHPGSPVETKDFRAENVFHIHGLGPDGLDGDALTLVATEVLGKALAIQKHASTWFGNGAHPSGALEIAGALSNEARKTIREQWEANYGGADKANKTVVLPDGTTWKSIAIDPQKSQAIEAAQMSAREVYSLFRMPPHLVGDLERGTFSNIEVQGREYVCYTLMTWARRWEEECQRKLLTDSDDLNYEILFDALLRGETKARYESYASAITHAWMSRNEVRIIEGLSPLDGLDEIVAPQSVFGKPEDGPPEEDEPDDEPEETDEDEQQTRRVAAMRPVFMQAVMSCERKEENAWKRAEQKHAGDSGGFKDWARDFYDAHALTLSEAVTPAATVLANGSAEPICLRWAENYCDDRRSSGEVPMIGGAIDVLMAELTKENKA